MALVRWVGDLHRRSGKELRTQKMFSGMAFWWMAPYAEHRRNS
jgi:hypothetical protein